MEDLDARALSIMGRALLGASAVGVLILDEELTVLYVSPGVKRILGSAPSPGTALSTLLAEPMDPRRLSGGTSMTDWHTLAFRLPSAHHMSVRCVSGELDGGGWMLLLERDGGSDAEAIIHAARLSNDLTTTVRELELRTRELEAAQGQIRQLDALLPICAACRRIRTEDGGWESLEEHISGHTESKFSHGMCPECGPKYYGEYWKG